MAKLCDFKAKVTKIINYVQTHCCEHEEFDEWIEVNGSWRRFEFKKNSVGLVEVFYAGMLLFACDSNGIITIDIKADTSLILFLCEEGRLDNIFTSE